jgi:hypothetical protein
MAEVQDEVRAKKLVVVDEQARKRGRRGNGDGTGFAERTVGREIERLPHFSPSRLDS